MARPTKRGLDYYPLDVEIFSDEKLICLNMLHGESGLLTYIRLLNRVYKNGGWYEWTEMHKQSLCHESNKDIDWLNKYVDSMLELGLFNQQVFSNTNCLTSEAIQLRVKEATGRRKKFPIPGALLLISIPDKDLLTPNNISIDINNRGGKESKVKDVALSEQKLVNVNNNPINDNINVVNVDNNPINDSKNLNLENLKLGKFQNVDINQCELEMLTGTYGKETTQGAIEFISDWARGKNKRGNAGDVSRFGVRAYRESTAKDNAIESSTDTKNAKPSSKTTRADQLNQKGYDLAESMGIDLDAVWEKAKQG